LTHNDKICWSLLIIAGLTATVNSILSHHAWLGHDVICNLFFFSTALQRHLQAEHREGPGVILQHVEEWK